MIVILLLCTIVSCKSIKGSYGVNLNCGSNRIAFISKNEFIEYVNLGYDLHSSWNYGSYFIKDGKINIAYKPIPEEEKYKSKNSLKVQRTESIGDSVEVEIKAFRHDSTKIDHFQVTVLNQNTGKVETGAISDGSQPIKMKIGKESFPYRLISGILGGNEIEFEIEKEGLYLIELYFDDIPPPTYNNKIGINGIMSVKEDSIGHFIEFEEVNGEKIDALNKYYKLK